MEANKLLLSIEVANLFSGHNHDRTLLDDTRNNSMYILLELGVQVKHTCL